MTNNWLITLNYFLDNYLKCSWFVMFIILINHFIIQINILYFFTNVIVCLKIFFFLLFEEIFIPWKYFANILVSVQCLFTFIKTHVILWTEIIKYSFCHKIYLHWYIHLHLLLYFINNCLILRAKVNFGIHLFVL